MTVANALGLDIDPSKVADIDIFSEEVRQNWREFALEWAGKPPFYSISYDMPYLVLASYEDNAEVLRGSGKSSRGGERFSTAYDNGAGTEVFDLFDNLPLIINLDGADHKRVRDAVQPAFTVHGVGIRVSFIEAAVDHLLDEIEAKGGKFDAMADLGNPIITQVLLSGMFQATPEQFDAFIRLNNQFPQVSATRSKTPEYREAFDSVVAVADAMLADAHEPRSDDFVGRLVGAYREERITRDEFVGQIMAIASGGLSATASSVGIMLYLMCRHPKEFAEVRRDPEMVPNAVEECLRFHPTGVVILPRFAKEMTEVGGATVYPRMPVVPCVPLANYDAAKFENPEKLDLRRDARHLSFGLGIHRCLGIFVARQILGVTMRKTLERFGEVRLVDPDFTPTYRGSYGELQPAEVPMQAA